MKSDKEIRKIIAQRLKECREEKGINQTELGILLGKAKTTIATWEQGRSMPDVETLYRLSLYYEKSLNYLYGVKDNDD